jgi:hypothetical protein
MAEKMSDWPPNGIPVSFEVDRLRDIQELWLLIVEVRDWSFFDDELPMTDTRQTVDLVRWLLLVHILGFGTKAATEATSSDCAGKVFDVLDISPRLIIRDRLSKNT